MLLFEIGKQLDVYSKEDNGWLIADIIEVKQHEIKIHYFTWVSTWDAWFRKDSTLLAPLNTHTLPITKLSPPPCKGNRRPRASMILHDKSIVFITADAIQKYDINNDEYSIVSESSTRFGQYVKLAYDFKKESIYITDRFNNQVYEFYIDDNVLHKREMDHMAWIWRVHETVILQGNPQEESGGVLHIIYGKHHGYYDAVRETFVPLQSFAGSNGDGNIVCVPTDNKLLYFKQKKCWEMNTKIDKSKRKFIESKTTIPERLSRSTIERRHIMNIYDTLVIMVDLNSKKARIGILDLITNGWFESAKQFPIISQGFQLIDGKDNYLYFMKISKRKGFMFKIHWMDIIPRKLCKLYKDQRYKFLIHGFVRNIEKRHSLYYNVPFYLKEMILKYYPCFLYLS